MKEFHEGRQVTMVVWPNTSGGDLEQLNITDDGVMAMTITMEEGAEGMVPWVRVQRVGKDDQLFNISHVATVQMKRETYRR